MTPPLFSVIIPTYDRPDLLAEAVGSVLAQTLPDLECIIVDDAGPRPPGAFDDPRVRVIRHHTNRGEPAARNTGVDAARGRYVTFLDDDDVYVPERLEIALEGLARAPVAVCWRANFQGVPGGNRDLVGDVHAEALDGMTPQVGQVAAPSSTVLRFDETLAALSDVDWFLRMSERYPVVTIPRVGMRYRRHSGARHGNGPRERIRCSYMLMEKHAEYFSRHPRATAFRWKRVGLMAASLGDFAMARRSFVRSLSIRPGATTAWHLARSMRRSTRNVDMEGVRG